jgi:glycosyltransferase 2 family protein
MKLRQIRVIIGLIISLIFLFLAFRGIDWGNAILALKKARYIYVLPGLLVYLLALWVRTYRWSFILPPRVKISTRKLFPLFILGSFVNNILPLRMGDVYRAYLLAKRENISKSSAMASIFVDKVFDALAVLTFLGIAAWALSSRFPRWEKDLFQTSSIILLGGVVCLWILLWNRTLANRLINWLLSHLSDTINKKLHPVIHNFLDGLDILRNHNLVLLAFFFSLVSWLIEAVMYYIIAYSLGTALPLYASPVILAIVNLAMMIPASPAGVGTFEFFCRKTAEPFFTPKSVAFAYAIFVHLAWFLPIIILGIYYMWHEHVSFHELKSESTE